MITPEVVKMVEEVLEDEDMLTRYCDYKGVMKRSVTDAVEHILRLYRLDRIND